MTVKELCEQVRFINRVTVVSGYNGKVLSHIYNVGKKEAVDNREVTHVEACLEVNKEMNYATTRIKIWVYGDVECDLDMEKRRAKDERDC